MEIRTALVCIAKGENRYIREWCEWHRGIGFDEIYIYDNNLVGERIDEAVGDLPYVHINNRYRNALQRNVEIQLKCYNEWYRAHRGDFTHFAFLDCDEFLNVSDDFNGLKDYIARVVRNAEGTRLYWKCHSDSGNLHYEDKPVRERFPQVVEPKDGRYFYKMLFSTRREEFKMINVHFSNHLSNIIDCNGKRINYSQSTYARDGVAYDCAWVDHYITKSAEEYFRNKRGKKDDARRLTVGFFFNFNEHTEEKDRYVAELVGIDVATVAKSNAGALEFHIDRKPETVVLDGMLENTVKMLPQKQAEAPKAVAGQEPKPAQVGEYPEGVSVCISAYQTQDYIEECLDSVEAQTWFKSHSNWEVLLGIDGCEKTLEKVRGIMHKYRNLRVFMMDRNVGTYVTCNTIMKQAKYKWLLRFDSDDVMFPNMVERILAYKDKVKFDVLRPYAINFGASNTELYDKHGCVLMRHKEVFDHFGGYKAWQCAADGDMDTRVRNFVTVKKYETNVFKRRMHANNLTRRKDTGLNSKLRMQYKAQIKTPASEQEARIECKTTTCKEYRNDVIVSLTTYPQRYKYLKSVIGSILGNTVQPYKICVCLYEKDVPQLPEVTRRYLSENNVEILVHKGKDIKPHTKYYPAMKKYKGYAIITIDDDVVYSADLIESLCKCYDKHKDCISARRIHKIAYKDGVADIYKNWAMQYTKELEPSSDLFATGVGGVLYPPNILDIDGISTDDIMKCLYADDIFLKYTEQKLGIKTVWAENKNLHGLTNLSKNDNSGLFLANVNENRNDKYLKIFKLYSNYNQ
jgi:glycosyltransferase involved in cell wall biosynthesis